MALPLPSENFLQQYQAFLQGGDLFAHQAQPTFLPFTTALPTPLDTAILEHWQRVIPPRLVLGKRVEFFLLHYLEQQPHLEVLTHNLQIIQEKLTLGELDFLYYNKEQQQHYHLEQVYKFYIYYPTEGEDLEHWRGPNNKDSLVEKLDKLSQKQFPLLQHPATQAQLQALGIPTDNILPQLSFKAALFTPWQQPFPSDSSLHPACWKGYWLTYEAFLQQDWQDCLFWVLDKKNWGIAPPVEESWLSLQEARVAIKSWLDRERAPLCWVKTREGKFLQFFVLWW